MASARDILNSFRTPRMSSTEKGNIGFDNPRENIDPHVKTKVLSSQEANVRRINEVRHTKNFPSIQAAIDDLPSTGGMVFIDAGTYEISSAISISSKYISIYGEGKASVVKLANNASCNAIEISGDDSKFITLRDFTLEGNRSNSASGSGILINSPTAEYDTYTIIEGLYIKNFLYDGIDIEMNNREVWISNINVWNCGRYGFHLDGTDHKIFNCVISDCQYGFYITRSNYQIVNCKAFNNTIGFNIESYGHMAFSNCQAQQNYNQGWNIYNDSAFDWLVSLNNCTASDNGTLGTGNLHGVLIDRDRVQIIGGEFTELGTGNQSYGIYISGSSVNCQVIGATAFDNSIRQIVDFSTLSGQNIIANNIEV